MTIVVVTHNAKVAERAHRTLWLKDGKVESLTDNPVHPPAVTA